MPLVAGTRLGPDQVVGLLVAGGEQGSARPPLHGAAEQYGRKSAATITDTFDGAGPAVITAVRMKLVCVSVLVRSGG